MCLTPYSVFQVDGFIPITLLEPQHSSHYLIDMNTEQNFVVDLDQAIVNLLGITSKEELLARYKLTQRELTALPTYFNIAMNILDEHLLRLPQLHKQEFLLIKEKKKC